MRILFTICGRAGSKGIKNKNLKNFIGYPLPYYTLAIIDLYSRKHSQHECVTVINTDSDDLVRLIKTYTNVKAYVVDRPSKLAEDNAPKVPVIEYSYTKIKEMLNVEFDMIVDLDLTSPLRTLNDLEALITKRASSTADVIFSVTESRRNPYFNMVKKTEAGYERVLKSNYNARQEAPEIFDMNASMYAYKPEFLLSGKGIFDVECDVIKMMDTAVLDIDHETDLIFMELIGKYLFDTDVHFKKIYDQISNCIRI